MNIQQAKTEIARTFRAYTRRGADGAHRIPPEKQRPVLLIGPPGIGKTAIMGQIAEETGCGLVAYAMTHHTRQSAIGLPYIAKKQYGGREYSVTEYTMSEIVASIYDYMERTGKRSGILFLDEINCVSETLTPAFAKQDLRQRAAARGLDHRGGGQSPGIQQVRPGAGHGDAGPGEAHRRGGEPPHLAELCPPAGHPSRHKDLSFRLSSTGSPIRTGASSS